MSEKQFFNVAAKLFILLDIFWHSLLINIKSNPNIYKKTKKIEYNVNIENKKQLEDRIAKLENKLTIKDDTKNKCWLIDSIIDGKRYKTMARCGKTPKDQALTKINNKKQQIINELTVYFEQISFLNIFFLKLFIVPSLQLEAFVHQPALDILIPSFSQHC